MNFVFILSKTKKKTYTTIDLIIFVYIETQSYLDGCFAWHDISGLRITNKNDRMSKRVFLLKPNGLNQSCIFLDSLRAWASENREWCSVHRENQTRCSAVYAQWLAKVDTDGPNCSTGCELYRSLHSSCVFSDFNWEHFFCPLWFLLISKNPYHHWHTL